jgi:hypothetical protein
MDLCGCKRDTADDRCVTMATPWFQAATAGRSLRNTPPASCRCFRRGSIRFVILAMTAEGERLAVEAESEGMHVSGKLYSNQYHFLLRFREGKVVEFKEYMDTEKVTEVLCGGNFVSKWRLSPLRSQSNPIAITSTEKSYHSFR